MSQRDKWTRLPLTPNARPTSTSAQRALRADRLAVCPTVVRHVGGTYVLDEATPRPVHMHAAGTRLMSAFTDPGLRVDAKTTVVGYQANDQEDWRIDEVRVVRRGVRGAEAHVFRVRDAFRGEGLTAEEVREVFSVEYAVLRV